MKYFLCIFTLLVFNSDACTFTMGYRVNERLPLIEAYPSNKGLYEDLFTVALSKFNCKLTIVREPKKRLIKGLIGGGLDFYPGFTFSKERSAYAFFFENGLDLSFVAISQRKQPSITSIEGLKSKIVLVAHGGPTLGLEHVGAIIRYVENLTIEDAIKYLLQGKADFYIYPKASIDYYLKMYPQKEIKRHACCGKARPMLLGFSKNSPHIVLKKNTNVIESKEVTYNPFFKMEKHSKAYALQQAIQQMKKEGLIEKIYKKHYQ